MQPELLDGVVATVVPADAPRGGELMNCTRCNNEDAVRDTTRIEDCGTCRGEGWLWVKVGGVSTGRTVACHKCYGTGEVRTYEALGGLCIREESARSYGEPAVYTEVW